MKTVKPTTLQDIARDAGVSTMAASVVLNGARSATRVSDATRTRILEAAARLRYRPNAVARGLSRRRMNALGVVAVVDGGADVNLYFLEVLNGIVAAAAASGQNTTICPIGQWPGSENKILQFCDGRVDGIVLLGPSALTPAFAETLRHRTPFFVVHGDVMPAGTDAVDIDDEQGVFEIVRLLIEQGHRRIAHFSGPMTRIGAGHRLAGYRRALHEAGIAFDESLVFPGDYAVWSGRDQANRLLDSRAGSNLPTAICCANDAIATGCLEALAQRGVRVPGDVSVAGFDDLLLARMTQPMLTTVAQPFRRMGEYAVGRLLHWIEQSSPARDGEAHAAGDSGGDAAGGDGSAPDVAAHVEIFSCEVVLRDSTGPPPRAPVTVSSA